ncbi:DUF2953 domain-containing protein [Sporomusa aerivorans]|uniref:DUF2953 domain-containing protein n=1 Tax=Sporomusa aerivorans TaxID=204936 RepID=UPI00352AC307
MISWLFILTAVGIILLLLTRVNLYIDVHCCRKGEDDFVTVTVYALKKLFLYSMKIPVIKVIQYNDFPWLTSEIKTSQAKTGTKVGREQRFAKKLLKLFVYNPQQFKHILHIAKRFFSDYRFYIGKLLRGLHCEKFELRVAYGFEDAALTGVMMGVVSLVIARIISSLHTQALLDAKPKVNIKPLFGHSHFEMELSCIFRIRLGNVITATMAKITNSSQGGDSQWLNIRYKV